jgi:colanic acid/amylovoran biosynthesis glycosyltransferase
VLALVAPSFNQVSETFIADHVKTLAPGRTVLVCQDAFGAEAYDCPVLCIMNSFSASPGLVSRTVDNALRRLRRQFGTGLSSRDTEELKRFFTNHRVKHVLGEFGYSGALMTDVCKALDIPLYVYFRGNDASSVMRHASTRRSYRRMFKMVSGVFCVSQYLADTIVEIGCPPDRIHVIPSGVLLDSFVPGTPQPGRLVAVGRLVEKKAPHLTIEAFARVAHQFPEARLDMVGDGPLKPLCEDVIRRSGMADRVGLHGALAPDGVQSLMQTAAIFVQHSKTAPNGDIEGFPTAIAEAMATALPVIATRHSGIPEHVRHGVSGMLVEEGDVGGMADAIAALLADPELAQRLGHAGREHAVRHLDRIATRQKVRTVMGLDLEPPAPNAALQDPE